MARIRKMAQVGPKIPQVGPKMPQADPKMPQDGPKKAGSEQAGSNLPASRQAGSK